ncbi:hypothetical protein QQX98_001364 [Neonectria punicea]|uniref:SGNH hydrolase-type esterase domain-containing protein n=1 Tax=Neonectria punicea TaxID=979145 RepID=A0ABR1HNI6_9HYPO
MENGKPSVPVEQRADLDNYIRNQGRVWFHELLHIDWAAAVDTINHIRDLKAYYHQTEDVIVKAAMYGASLNKALARWKYDPAYWIKRNADSLTMYAMAKIDADGTTTILDPEKWDVCNAAADGEGPWDDGVFFNSSTGFADRSMFPEEYLVQYDAWREEAMAQAKPLSIKNVSPVKAVKPGTTLRILCVGDSITYGYLSEQDGGDGNGYRLQLRKDLSKDKVVFAGTRSVGTMENGNFAAWPGKTIKFIGDNVGLSLKQRPNIILLHAGTNDMDDRPERSTEGNDPAGVAERLGNLIDQMIKACPDATILVAMIIDTCDPHKSPRTPEYQSMIPRVVRKRRSAGHKVLAVDFTTFPQGDLRDCIHPTNAGYRDMGDYWYDFITQIPNGWIKDPVGDDPAQSESGSDKNGGIATDIPAPDRGDYPIEPTSKSHVRAAAEAASEGGTRSCKSLPLWESTGQIASNAGKTGDWQFKRNWVKAGQVADGIGKAGKNVRLHDMDGDGKADYVWLDPDNGQLICWINNLPDGWVRAGNNGGIIGDGTGSPSERVYLALDDYLIVNPDNGAVRVWWNEGPDANANNGWKWTMGGEIAEGAKHANLATLRFPDINGDGRADYVFIGKGGALVHWMNTGSDGSRQIEWVSRKGIATGEIENISKLVLADIDGGGRDDYLIWDDDAGLGGFLNQPSNREGVPVWVNQGLSKSIAHGVNVDPATVFLADMDGDGKADYAHIDKNGAVNLWYNRGTTENYMAIDGVRFADIDGDGRDDYIWLDPDSGPPSVHLNKGLDDDTNFGWKWAPMNGGNPIAAGVAPADQVRFADINGDGKDDYIVVDAKTGGLRAYINEGKTDSEYGWRFRPIGKVANGGWGKGANVRLADIDGDGFDDYIYLDAGGATITYRNDWNEDNPIDSWVRMKGADAVGIGQRPEEIEFYDINGDGKADYVWTSPLDGRVRVWLNHYPNDPPWRAAGEIAGGVGTSGLNVRFATLQKTGRASYVAINRTPEPWQHGSTAATASGRCRLQSRAQLWVVFEGTAEEALDVCDSGNIQTEAASEDMQTPNFPTKISSFKAHGEKGCKYSGTKDEHTETLSTALGRV